MLPVRWVPRLRWGGGGAEGDFGVEGRAVGVLDGTRASVPWREGDAPPHFWRGMVTGGAVGATADNSGYPRMRRAITLGLSLWMSVVAFSNPPRTARVAGPNANTRPAGSLAHGVLTLSLEARRTVWYPNGDSLPGREVLALGEASGPAVVPGPLVRVPAGTIVEL